MTVARTFAAAMGALLTVVALLGFFGNPIVGAGTGAPLLVTGIVHDLVHLTTGRAAAVHRLRDGRPRRRPMRSSAWASPTSCWWS